MRKRWMAVSIFNTAILGMNAWSAYVHHFRFLWLLVLLNLVTLVYAVAQTRKSNPPVTWIDPEPVKDPTLNKWRGI